MSVFRGLMAFGVRNCHTAEVPCDPQMQLSFDHELSSLYGRGYFYLSIISPTVWIYLTYGLASDPEISNPMFESIFLNLALSLN